MAVDSSATPPEWGLLHGLQFRLRGRGHDCFEFDDGVAPGVRVCRTGGHTPGHSIVRLESGGDRLTFAGDTVSTPGFDNPSGTTRTPANWIADARPRGEASRFGRACNSTSTGVPPVPRLAVGMTYR
jgi:glyoxylase-like metal-dependent hydrolase (beta-lactamase superfamily II)